MNRNTKYYQQKLKKALSDLNKYESSEIAINHYKYDLIVECEEIINDEHELINSKYLCAYPKNKNADIVQPNYRKHHLKFYEYAYTHGGLTYQDCVDFILDCYDQLNL